MSETSPLSPMTNYYLRKFIEDRQLILRALLPNVVGKVTLEILIQQMKQEGTLIDQKINEIESLVSIHKKLIQSAPSGSIEVENLDQRLLFSLGLEGKSPNHVDDDKKAVLVARDSVEILNVLKIKAQRLLGGQISMKYLLETRPQEQWCQKFKLSSKGKVTYDGPLNEQLNSLQIKCLESWVSCFSDRCRRIMPNFNQDASEDNQALFDDI